MLFYNFLEKNSGTWVTQRTIYLTQQNTTNIYKSKMSIKRDGQIEICNSTKDEFVYCLKDLVAKQVKSLLESAFYCKEEIQTATKTISDISNTIDIYMNKVNHISVSHSVGNLNSSEKVWLVNPNLRLSFSIIKKTNQCVAISFSSDIRIE